MDVLKTVSNICMTYLVLEVGSEKRDLILKQYPGATL